MTTTDNDASKGAHCLFQKLANMYMVDANGRCYMARLYDSRRFGRATRMCRSIRTLYNIEPPATGDEIHAAALQYVRKISGYRAPSLANTAAFQSAVEAITAISVDLLAALETAAPPRDRAVEAAKARARGVRRGAR